MAKSKEIQAAKASAKKGADKARKKWSQGRVKEKLNNKVYYDKKAYSQLLKEVPKMKVISVSRISEALGIVGGMAKLGIAHLEKEGLITPVSRHSGQIIYTNVVAEAPEEKVEIVAAKQ